MLALQKHALLLALAGLSMGPAQAAAELTAEFRDPTGTVASTDSISIWVTLRSVGDQPFTFNWHDAEPFGLDPSVPLPASGNNFAQGLYNQPFGSYSQASLFTFRNCDDTFSPACSPGGAYKYSVPASGNWFNTAQPFSLAPGETLDIALYTLAPTGGSAAPGVYQAFSMGVGLTVHGFAADGVTKLEADLFRAGTCAGQSHADCSFTRTVLAPVPEPASMLLLLAGLAALGFAVPGRRRGV